MPRVLPGSGLGQGATWIGAEGPGSREDGPFIQVGTNEGRFASGDATSDDDAQWAFWTDTTHHFAPITMFPVRGGDRIATALTLRGGRWIISIADLSSGTKETFSTSEETRYSFNMGEWEQEDVGTLERPGPYPRLSVTTVWGLRANGSAPDHGHLLSTWMSSNQGTLVPSPLARDSFTLRQVRLGAAAARYLSIAMPENEAYRAFVWLMQHWTAHTPTQQILSQQAAFGDALQAAFNALSDARWPPAAQPRIDELMAQTRELFAFTTSGEAAFPGGLARWKALFSEQLSRVAASAREVRTVLRLPAA